MAQDDKDYVPITLRIPKDVHARLKRISDDEYRSLNHQIIMALTYFTDAHDEGKLIPAWLRGAAKPPVGRAR